MGDIKTNNLNISKQMFDALKSEKVKSLVNDILKDGQVDKSDDAKINALRQELEEAAKADDGKIDKDEDSLLDALDSTGWFGTNEAIVKENLEGIRSNIQAKADLNPNQLNFGIKTQDGVSGFFGGEQNRILRLRDIETQQGASSPTGGTTGTSMPAPTEGTTAMTASAPADGPAQTNTNLSASSTQEELNAQAVADTHRLSSTINLVQSRLNSDPQIRANIQAQELQYESGNSLATNEALGLTADERAKVAEVLGVPVDDPKVNAYIAGVLDTCLKRNVRPVEPANPELQSMIKARFDAYAQAKTDARITQLNKYITDFKANPNSAEAVRNLYNWIATPPDSNQFLTEDPTFNKAFTEIQVDILNARNTTQMADNLQHRMENRYYQTPSSLTELQKQLSDNKSNIFNTLVTDGIPEPGPLPQAVEQAKQLADQLDALRQSNPQAYSEIFGSLDLASLRQTASELSALALNQEEPVNEETMRQLTRLNVYTGQLAGAMDKINDQSSPELQAIKTTFEAVNTRSADALSKVKADIDFRNSVKAEFQTVRNDLQDLLKNPDLAADVKISLTEQLNAVNSALTALENNQNLPTDPASQTALSQVIEAITAAKQEAPNWFSGFSSFNFGFGFGLPFLMPFSYSLSSPLQSQQPSLSPTGFRVSTGQFQPSLTGGLGYSASDLALGQSVPQQYNLASPFDTNLAMGVSETADLPLTMASDGYPTEPATVTEATPITITETALPDLRPTSIREALLTRTQQNSLNANIEVLRNNTNPSIQAALKDVQSLLQDSTVPETVKTHLRDSLYAQRLVAEGKGDTLIGGVKASDLAQDMSFLIKLANYQEGADFELNKQLMLQATERLRSAEGGDRLQLQASIESELFSDQNMWEIQAAKLDAAVEQKQQFEQDIKNSEESTKKLSETVFNLYNKLNAGSDNEKALAQKMAETLRKHGIEINQPGMTAKLLEGQFSALPPATMAALGTQLSEIGKGLSPENAQQPFAAGAQPKQQLTSAQSKQELANQFSSLQTQFNNVNQQAQTINQTFQRNIEVEIQNLQRLRAQAPSNLKSLYDGMIKELMEMKNKFADPNYRFTEADRNRHMVVSQARLTIERVLQEATKNRRVNRVTGNLAELLRMFNPPAGGGATMSFNADQFRLLSQKLFRDAGSTTADQDVMVVQQETAEGTNQVVGAMNSHNRLRDNVGRNSEVLEGGTGENGGNTSPTATGTGTPTQTQTQTQTQTDTQTGSDETSGNSTGTIGHIDPKTGFVGIVTMTAGPRPSSQPGGSGDNGGTENTNPFAGFIEELERVSTLSTEKQQNWAERCLQEIHNINRSYANFEKYSGEYAQQMAPLLQQMDQILEQQQNIVHEMEELSLADANLSAEAEALIAKADEVANAVLAPKPEVAGETFLSELLQNFLKSIRDLDFQTRKLVMTQMTQRMVNNAITRIYKEKADENATYHEKMLKELANGFKQQIETMLANTLSNSVQSGQAAMAAGAQLAGATGDAISTIDKGLRNQFSTLLERPTQDNMMTRVQKQKILQALFDGSRITGQEGIMTMLDRFQRENQNISLS